KQNPSKPTSRLAVPLCFCSVGFVSSFPPQTSQLTGTVDDCCVDYSTVDTATKTSFMPLLKDLQKRYI
ncbi:unnamed protein product, partial [Laminaria digitata]